MISRNVRLPNPAGNTRPPCSSIAPSLFQMSLVLIRE